MCVVVDDGQDLPPSMVGPQRSRLSARHLHSHLSPAAEEQENHCKNNKSKRLDKSGLYPQKSRINMKNVNVCSGGEKDRKTS